MMTKQDNLSIAVIINSLSTDQLTLLNKYFEQLSCKHSLLLIKQVPCFPVVFYQLRDILLLEKEIGEAAKEELYKAGRHFNVPAIRRVIHASTHIHVFQALPEVDHFIGHGLDNRRFFLGSQHPAFIGNVRRWIELYAIHQSLRLPQITEKKVELANDPIFLPENNLSYI